MRLRAIPIAEPGHRSHRAGWRSAAPSPAAGMRFRKVGREHEPCDVPTVGMKFAMVVERGPPRRRCSRSCVRGDVRTSDEDHTVRALERLETQGRNDCVRPLHPGTATGRGPVRRRVQIFSSMLARHLARMRCPWMATAMSRNGKYPTGPRRKAGIVAVDLFCGAGGKTHGFFRGGIEVAVGVDIDPTCRFPYEYNNSPARFVEKNVAKLTVDEIAGWYPRGCTRVLIGCTPCQPFSVYSYRYGAADGRNRTRDKRWGLLNAFRSLVQGLLPEVVTVENVPELALMQHGVYSAFVKNLSRLGYNVTSRIVKCADYGVPQTRERLVVLASRLGNIDLIAPTHPKDAYVTVRDTIGALPPIAAGEAALMGDPLHRACRLSPMNLQRIRATPEGGGWSDWPEELRLACHRRDSGKTYPSVYGRMRWDDLAPTLTTQCFGLGNGRFGHPEQDRAISLREAALLQTFPIDYQFVEPGQPVTFKHVGKHIGNAVPARLGEVIALSIRKHVQEHNRKIPQLEVPPPVQARCR